jgi:hypothetical protein
MVPCMSHGPPASVNRWMMTRGQQKTMRSSRTWTWLLLGRAAAACTPRAMTSHRRACVWRLMLMAVRVALWGRQWDMWQNGSREAATRLRGTPARPRRTPAPLSRLDLPGLKLSLLFHPERR